MGPFRRPRESGGPGLQSNNHQPYFPEPRSSGPLLSQGRREEVQGQLEEMRGRRKGPCNTAAGVCYTHKGAVQHCSIGLLYSQRGRTALQQGFVMLTKGMCNAANNLRGATKAPCSAANDLRAQRQCYQQRRHECASASHCQPSQKTLKHRASL